MDFPIALYIFCAILYFTRDWQTLHFAVGTACAFGLPLLVFVIPESPRWLVMHNKKDEAIKIFLQVYMTNTPRALVVLSCFLIAK